MFNEPICHSDMIMLGLYETAEIVYDYLPHSDEENESFRQLCLRHNGM